MDLIETGKGQTDTIMGFCAVSQRTVETKGINQHRAVQTGECPYHGERYWREIDWTNRRVGKWKKVEASDG